MKYRAYRTKSDNLYHFQFTYDQGDPILNGGPFQEKEDCFEGIRAVMMAAGNSSNYTQKTAEGKSYFIISDGSKELGQSIGYNNAAASAAAAKNAQKEIPSAKAKGAEPEKTKKSTTSEKSSSSGTDDYRPLAFYDKRISGIKNGFDRFSDEGEHYFTYNLDGYVVLISEGYSSENSRENGIKSVSKNMDKVERYQQKIHSNGKHYFNLRAGNNQEIATSRWFHNEDNNETAIILMTSGGKGKGKIKSIFGKSGAIYPDYKPLDFYVKHIEGVEFGYESFEEEDKHYFTVNQKGGPVLISEIYQSAAARDKGIASVKRNAKKEIRYAKERHPNGKYYFRLLAGNKQEIATSKWFDNSKDRDRAIEWLVGTGGTKRRKKSTRKPKTEVERTYVNQGLSYPCSDITYSTFQSGGNKKYYFVFKDKNDKAILINGDVRGYETAEAAAAAIERIFEYAPDPKNYLRKESKNAKHYFFIKDENDKNVARGSLFYKEKDVMEEAIKMIACGKVVAAGGAASAESTGKNKAVLDDYLPCEAYTGATGFHTFFNEERKEHYFAYNDQNGKTFLRSEGYSSTAGRDNGIESVKKNSPIDARWGKGSALNGKYHYYFLKAGNNQEIARSCYHTSEAEMLADYEWVRGGDSEIGAGAGLFAGSWMAANALSSKKAEGDSQRKTEEAEKLRLTAEAEAKRKEEEAKKARLAAEAEAKQKAEEAQRAAEAEAKRKAEEAEKAAEAEKMRLAAEAEEKKKADLAKAASLAALAAATRKKEDEEKARLAAEAEAEAKRKAEEAQRAAEAEAKRKAEEARLAAEAEAKRKAEAAEKERLALLAATKRKEEEAEKARLAAEAEAKRKAEAVEKERLAALATAKRKEEEAEKVRLAAEAKKKADDNEKARLAALAAAAAAAVVPEMTGGGSDKKESTAFADSKMAASGGDVIHTRETVEKKRGWGWLLWLIPLLLLLAFLLWKGCGGCNTSSVVPPVLPAVDTVRTEPEIKTPFGQDGAGMGYTEGSTEFNMANFLSDPDRRFPKAFMADNITFAKGSTRLNSSARKQLDNIIALMKEYPTAKMDITGLLYNESGTYRGSKEISLDDVRAREVYNYLKKGGISEKRLDFSGGGTFDRRTVEFTLIE